MSWKKPEHLFISYQHNDRDAAAMLEKALVAAGFSVWWDERLQTGQEWHQEIDRALLNAVAVIVLWSERAIQSEWVRHEASIAKIRNVLTHATIDGSTAPELFSSIQCANLSQWGGSCDDPIFLGFANGLKNAIRKNRMVRWYKAARSSVVVLLLASTLIYFGYWWQSRETGPLNVITGWAVDLDHAEIAIDFARLSDFYPADQWDIAIICHDEEKTKYPMENPDSSYTFLPMSWNKSIREPQKYIIKYHDDMADNLTLASSVGCLFSVVEKSRGLTKASTYIGPREYQGFTRDGVAKAIGISLDKLKLEIEDSGWHPYRRNDVCRCAVRFDELESQPPD